MVEERRDLMATTSFDQKFVLSKEKADEFIEVVTAPSSSFVATEFHSQYMPDTEAKEYLKEILKAE